MLLGAIGFVMTIECLSLSTLKNNRKYLNEHPEQATNVKAEIYYNLFLF